jgi:hypothetical protein
MKSLHITGTSVQPEIHFDKAKAIFEISGNSLADDPAVFFKPVLDWLAQYRNNPNENTQLHIKMDYINLASARHFLDIFYSLETVKNSRVQWFYKNNNIEMRESGEEFAEIVNIPFEFIAI